MSTKTSDFGTFAPGHSAAPGAKPSDANPTERLEEALRRLAQALCVVDGLDAIITEVNQ